MGLRLRRMSFRFCLRRRSCCGGWRDGLRSRSMCSTLVSPSGREEGIKLHRMRLDGRFAWGPILLLLALLLSVPCGHGQTVQLQEPAAAEYAIAFRLPLSRISNGVDGNLELLQDARLTLKLSSLLWGPAISMARSISMTIQSWQCSRLDRRATR